MGEMRAPTLDHDPKTAAAKAPDTSYFVVAPGSLRVIKKWPAELFAQIARRLQIAPAGAACSSAPLVTRRMLCHSRRAGRRRNDRSNRTDFVGGSGCDPSEELSADRQRQCSRAYRGAVRRPDCRDTWRRPSRPFLALSPGIHWLRPVAAVMHPMHCYNC